MPMKVPSLGLFNMFSGGALERMSILAVGDYAVHFCIDYRAVNVYGCSFVGSFEKEGEQGKRKINQYTRQGTLFLCTRAGNWDVCWLISQGITLTDRLLFYVPAVTSLVCGNNVLMWLGEQITERGVGNGISMIILPVLLQVCRI